LLNRKESPWTVWTWCRSVDRPFGQRWRMRGGRQSGPRGRGSGAAHGAACAWHTREAGKGGGRELHPLHSLDAGGRRRNLIAEPPPQLRCRLGSAVYRLKTFFQGFVLVSLPRRASRRLVTWGQGLSRAGHVASPDGRITLRPPRYAAGATL